MIDDFYKSVSILKELTTLTLVVCLVTGVNAVGRLCFHLGQMGSADMTGSGSDYIVADSTLDRISFGCFSTIRCMISFVILSIAAGAFKPVAGRVALPFVCPVVTESIEFYLFLGERYTGGAVLIELAAAGITAALVVLNVTGVSAVGIHWGHIAQVVGADMPGS